jgi:integrase
MDIAINNDARVIEFPRKDKQRGQKSRKSGLNINKKGSARKINGQVYIDFIYLEERARENSGLPWNEKNAKHVREQLDKIMVAIRSGTFRYAKVFPNSKNADYFTAKEIEILKLNKTPNQVLFKDYVWRWYEMRKGTGDVSGRTLWGDKSHINCYLMPFFGELTFANFNKITFNKFVEWAKQQKYRSKSIENETINKIFTLLKMIVNDAAIEYDWGATYNPFFGFKKRRIDNDPYDKILPFSVSEQKKIISNLPDHWKSYFDVAFKIGLRQEEQIALKSEDIDWDKGLLHIKRAITRDENGKPVEGTTKNKHSRRTIELTPKMLQALMSQVQIYDQYKCEYFFCTTEGKRICPANLRKRVWIPCLKKACIQYRDMRQTRHSYATNSLSCNENRLWIANVMGHRDTSMIEKVYAKYKKDAAGSSDGSKFDDLYSDDKIEKE